MSNQMENLLLNMAVVAEALVLDAEWDRIGFSDFEGLE